MIDYIKYGEEHSIDTNKPFNIEELSELEYNYLTLYSKICMNTLYVTYYDKRNCLLCLKEFKRSTEKENPNFCQSCLKKLKGEEVQNEKT